MKHTASLLVLFAGSTALASPAAPHAGPPAPASIYRFDVSIAGIDATPATYTLVLAEDRRGELRSGTNIPYGSTASGPMRYQLGVNLGLSFTQRGSVLLVSGKFDMSSLVPASGTASPTWSRIEANDLVVPVTPGKPTELASVYDITTHHRYEVTITARRVM